MEKENKEKILNHLLKYKKYVFYILAILFTIQLCIRNYRLKTELKTIKNVEAQIIPFYDTIYIDRPYEVNEPLKEKESPTKTVIFNEPEDSIELDTKVISIDLSTEMVKLSTAWKDSVYSDNYYPLNLSAYQYRYVDGQLSKQKIPFYKRFSPYVGISYRPFNNLWDLSGGISFKTKSFNYKLGLNLYYYPKFPNKVNLDLELGIIYNF